ncbi:ANTAR domain-containing protein [Kineococcus sp. TBRC 1896]|uniref:ANTAR domain-containing protein n=1 Tax=Kineococcus mangrovi TaxID=1660183 RepID=A0ABV4I1B6_9ACTN
MHDEDGRVAELGTLDTGRERSTDTDVGALRAELAQLRTALTRRPVIDMAKGAIMALTRCDEDAAFRQLSEVSQTHNVKLYDLASALLGDLRRSGTAAQDGGDQREVDRLVQRNWTRR